MALEYVKAGETVKASTVNSLVDVAKGTQTPSPDLVYTTTPRGTQLAMPSNYGGPLRPLRHFLDTEYYILSGWQFTKLALGFSLDSCLGTIKYHDADGEVTNPVSAAVVFKNSSESPIGSDLSGYLLSDDNFGLDALAGSNGLVETPIEWTNGQVPARAELWSWSKPDGMAAVFTNVEDTLSVKQQLSSLLEDGGVDSEELSALECLGSWKLTESTMLSAEEDGHVVWKPTHQLVHVHDDIEFWDSEEVKTHHVNSASVVCYNIEEHQDSQTGKRVIDNAKFAWKYWLGPDSEYEEGESINFVYSHSWTINGQPAVFKVDEEIDELTAYDGSDVAIQDERGGYSILHGEFELNPEDGEQGQIVAGSLFVNFNYYDTYAAMIGELGGANYSTADDLSRSVLLAKQKEPFTADEEELSLGDEIPRRLLIYGTYSAVDKDWPLPDTTCPEYVGENQKSKKSLEWKDNKPEDGHTEPVDDTGVKSLQIYRFSEVIKSQCDRLSDLQLSDQVVFLARRQDKDGGAFVDYINLDELSSLVDSKCETLYLSSIQEKTYTFTDDQGVSHSLPYHQLYGFDGAGERLDPDNIDKYEIVVRKSQNPGAIVSYVPLSSVLSSSGVFTDTQIAETSSIQFDDDGNGPYLELFKFNDGDYGDSLALHELGDREIVVREGDHVNYITLSGDALSDIIPDATMQDGQKSIDWLTNSHDRVIQLYKFDQPGMLTIPQTDVIANGNAESLIPEEYEFVVRKNGPGGEIEYMQAKLSVQHEDLSVDSEGVTGQKSIAFLGDSKELQLYKFNQGGQGTTSALVPTYWEDPAKVLPSNYEFIVRKGGAGGEVEYKKLELKQAQLSVDRQGHPSQKSLQYCDLGDGAFLELDHFHSNGMTLPKVSLTSADVSLLPNNHEFLIRKKVGGFWQIDYAPLSACVEGALSATVSVDTDVVHSQRSIEWAEDNNEEYLQLYNFDAGSIRVDPRDWASYDLVIRDFKTINGSIVNYTNLSSLASSMVSVAVDSTVQLLSGLSCEPDAKYPQLHLSSIQDDDFVDPKTGLRYHQLFNFQNEGIDIPPSDMSSFEVVVRDSKTDPTGKIVNYAKLSSLLSSLGTISCDTEKVVTRKSLDLVLSGENTPYYQLHNFQTSADNGPDTWLKFWDQPLSGEDFSIGCQTQFVVRVPDGNNGYEVKYMQLSAYQQHERVDTGTMTPRGRSVDYTAYDEGYGCYQVLQLYGFDWGCSHFTTSADISSYSGNGILIRKWDDYGCCWQLDYMGFDSLDELAIKYIGDSQLSLSAHRPYQRSAEVFYDQADQKKFVQLYGFDTDIDNASVTIHNDGCTYYWPQDIRTDQQLSEWDYILVKHIDSSGNITLQYKQLEVTMPDIDSIQGDINNIYGEINNFYDEINYLSGCIDDLSGHLSGDYWESGGYSDTCYGHTIGDGDGCLAIDLDNHTFYGNYWWFTGHSGGGWFGGNNLDVEGCADLQSLRLDHLGNGAGLTFANGCTYIYNSNSYFDGTVGVGCQLNIGCTWINGGGAYVDGSMTVNSGCAFQVGCSYLDQSTLQVGCSIRIGNTQLDEAQLSALLQLVNAPQMLQNL